MSSYIRTEFVKVCPGHVVHLELHIFYKDGEQGWFRGKHLSEIEMLLSDVMKQRVEIYLEKKRRSRRRRRNKPSEKPCAKENFTKPEILTGQTLRMAYSFKKTTAHNHLMLACNKHSDVPSFVSNRIFEEKLVVYVYHIEGYNQGLAPQVSTKPLQSQSSKSRNVTAASTTASSTVVGPESLTAEAKARPGTSSYFTSTASGTDTDNAKVDFLKKFARKPKKVKKIRKQSHFSDASMADFVTTTKLKRTAAVKSKISLDEDESVSHSPRTLITGQSAKHVSSLSQQKSFLDKSKRLTSLHDITFSDDEDHTKADKESLSQSSQNLANSSQLLNNREVSVVLKRIDENFDAETIVNNSCSDAESENSLQNITDGECKIEEVAIVNDIDILEQDDCERMTSEVSPMQKEPKSSTAKMNSVLCFSEEEYFDTLSSHAGSGDDLFSDLSEGERMQSLDERLHSFECVNNSVETPVDYVQQIPEYSSVSSPEASDASEASGRSSPHFLSIKSSKMEQTSPKDISVQFDASSSTSECRTSLKISISNVPAISVQTQSDKQNSGRKCKIKLKVNNLSQKQCLVEEDLISEHSSSLRMESKVNSKVCGKRKRTCDVNSSSGMSPMSKRHAKSRTKALEKVLEELDDNSDIAQHHLSSQKRNVPKLDKPLCKSKSSVGPKKGKSKNVYDFESDGSVESDSELTYSNTSGSTKPKKSVRKSTKEVMPMEVGKVLSQESCSSLNNNQFASVPSHNTSSGSVKSDLQQSKSGDIETVLDKKPPRLRLSKSRKPDFNVSPKPLNNNTEGSQKVPEISVKVEKNDKKDVGRFFRRSRRSIIVQAPPEVIDVDVEDIFSECVIQEELSSVVIKIEDTVADAMEEELRGVQQVCDLTNDQLKYLVTSNERYLRNIFQGKSYCRRHEDFKRGGQKRSQLKWQVPLGLYLEDQLEDLLMELHAMFCKRHTKYLDYVLKVMFPEILIKIYMEVKKVDYATAEDDMEPKLDLDDSDNDIM